MRAAWYREIVERSARSHDLDPDLLHALILVESSGHADAFRFEPGVWERYCKDNPRFNVMEPRRVASSYGLCQMLFITATDYGFKGDPEYLFMPGVNSDMSAMHLRKLLRWAEGDRAKALEAYNGGRGHADGKGPDAEYARRVLGEFANLKVTL